MHNSHTRTVAEHARCDLFDLVPSTWPSLFYIFADGTTKTLTNKDFATMDPANMKGSNLERLLAEHLGLKPMR